MTDGRVFPYRTAFAHHDHHHHRKTKPNREVAALKTLTKADALALWDTHVAATSATRRKLAVYVFSRAHSGSKLRPSSSSLSSSSGAEGGKGTKTVVVDSMAALRGLKRGLPLYPAPRAVVKEEELLLSAQGGTAAAAAS